MPRSFLLLQQAARLLLPIATAVGIPGWFYRFITDLLDDMNFSLALAISIFGLAATIGLALAVTYGLEFYLERSSIKEKCRRVADLLDGLLLSGREEVDAKRVVNYWYEEQPDNKFLRLATKSGLYARLRLAVEREWIESKDFQPNTKNANFTCKTADVIRVFRSDKWLVLMNERAM